MAFVVEDGTGKSDANSYVTVAEIDEYATDRGLSALVAETNPNKQAWAIEATDWIEMVFTGIWKGRRKLRDQALSWPRLNVLDLDGFRVDSAAVPSRLKNSVIEAIEWRRQGKKLIKNVAIGGQMDSVKIGQIGVTWKVPPSVQPLMTKAATWLAHFLDRSRAGRARFVEAEKV